MSSNSGIDHLHVSPPWDEPTQEELDEYLEEQEAGRRRDEQPYAYGTMPTMPRAMKHVYQQIIEHPHFMTRLNEATRLEFQCAVAGVRSARTRVSNKRSREVWSFLYLDKPLPSC